MTSEPRDHVAIATAYAQAVVDGEIPACRYTVLAVARQLQDLERAETDPDWPYRFDPEAAARVCKFVELMPHVEGEWARRRELIVLQPWQCFILTTVFGWVRRDNGMRRFRTAYDEVARKNAKSTLTAAVANYMLAVDGEAGAQVYAAATKKDQAKYVFKPAQAMARRSLEFRLRYGVEVFAHSIAVPASASTFVALDAKAETQDGMNPHFVSMDELHAHKKRALFDVMETAMGARAQPLMWIITTAGADRLGICYEQRTHLIRVLEGTITDESFFGIIYTIDADDDWRDPACWPKANPNYDVSVYADALRDAAKKAALTPAARNNFLTKRLNVWVNAAAAWMNMDAWDAAADPALQLADFEDGTDCYPALDLASKVDIAAKVRLFVRDEGGEEHYYAFGDYYTPRAQVEDGDNDAYAGWEIEGLLTVTEGNVIDFDAIEEGVREDCRRFNVREVPFDPWQATQMASHLLEEGVPMVEIRATVANFSEAMKALEAAVLDGRFHHDGNPVLRWMVSNVVCHYDAKDNVYPRKERPENKIDGVVALIMAMARAFTPGESGGAIYLPDDFREDAAA